MRILGFARRYWFEVLIATIYLLFVYWGFQLLQSATTIEYPDSADYHSVTLQQPVTSPDFWAGRRTLTTPLIWRIFGTKEASILESYLAIPTVYTVFSLVSWGLLALAVAVAVRTRWLKAVSFTVILAIGLSKMIFFWNWVLLSESPFISFLVLFLALAIFLLHYIRKHPAMTWSKQVLILLGVSIVIFFWSFTRDTNAFIALGAAAILSALLIWQRKKNYPKVLLIGLIFMLVGVSGIQMQTAKIGHRWQYPFVNVLGQRILPNDEYREFFINHGLPTNPETMRFVGGWANSHGTDWSGFNSWLNSEARSAYFRFLLTHPAYLFLQPIYNLSDLVDGDWSVYGKHTVLNSFQNKVTDFVWPQGKSLVLVAILAIGIASWLAFRRRLTPHILLALSVLLLVVPGVMIAWHGDAMEVVRHSGGNGLQLRLALVLIIIFSLDAALSPAKNTSRS